MPLVERGRGDWEAAGLGFRPRFRPVLGSAEPDEAVLGALAEAAARAGARRLHLPALPSRDPATAALERALQAAGYQVRSRPGSQECLTPVEGGWDEHRRRFKKLHRTVKNFSNKASRLGALELHAWESPESPVAPELERYVALHGAGWKGALSTRMRVHRERLFAGADARGWSRFYLLSVAERPAAAILWLRIGEVAIAYSTVYDERLAALSAGTILMWRSHEPVFGETAPALVDYLPGRGAQKSQLGLETSPLTTLEATRGRNLASGFAPLGDRLRRGAARALRAIGPSGKTEPSPEQRRHRKVRVEAAAEATEAELLAPDATLELWLAVCGAHPSVKRMKECWGEEDAWWRVGAGPDALVRLAPEADDGSREALEIVALTERAPEELLAELAHAVGGALVARLPAEENGEPGAPLLHADAALPWPLA